MEDITASDVREGRDIQGIPWGTLNVTREEYRDKRIPYHDYQDKDGSVASASEECKSRTIKVENCYMFRRFSRSVQSSCFHYQLKNLAWATSMHDVYTTSDNKIFHWSVPRRVNLDILDVSGPVVPNEIHPGNLDAGFPNTQISTFAVKDRMLIVGGSDGQLILKNLDKDGVCYCARTAPVNSANITTAIEFYSDPSAHHFIVSSNDGGVRECNMETFQKSNQFNLSWPVNHASMSPDGKCLLVVGDAQEFLLLDASNNRPTTRAIKSHFDYGSASAWHPDGNYFATGNQDKTCRIWDRRMVPKCLDVLKGNLGAIRSIRFTSDGQYMAMGESADFIHLYDVHCEGGYRKEQEIDFFGELSGMCFSPGAESLFVSVSHPQYGGLLEFRNKLFRRYHQVG